jgi:hypothetical protein|tara:strand:+ start:1019 stop:1279 length:261 start_codon:yes stop_codon:yes gene_type:complete
VTCKNVIIRWLLHSNTKVIYNHLIETELKEYAALFYSKKHNSETWTRAFRELRAEQNLLKKYDLKLVEIPSNHAKEKGWKIVKNTI